MWSYVWADDLLGVPREPHLAVRVPGTQQTHQPFVLVIGELLGGHHEAPPGTEQRVVLAAAMAERLVLHAAPALVERGVGELDDMERVGDLDGVWEHRVEHGPIGGRQVERRPLDPRTPRFGPPGEPAARLSAVAALNDVEQLSGADVDDLGRPALRAELPDPAEQGLVQPERGHCPEPAGSSINSVPKSSTASITACHPHPRSAATSDTARP